MRGRLKRVVDERLMRARMSVDGLRRGVLQRDGEKLLREPMMRLDSARGQLGQAVRVALDAAGSRVIELRSAHKAHHPARVLERRVETVAVMRRQLERVGLEVIERRNEQVQHFRGLLRALGPDSAFQRGFSITLAICWSGNSTLPFRTHCSQATCK